MPAISCGIFGYPMGQAAAIAVAEARVALACDPGLSRVIFACFGDEVAPAYQAELGGERA